MALWLCDLTHPNLDRDSIATSIDFLLRELPDFWTADEVVRFSAEVRQQVGPKASRIAWLNAAGWLVGEREQLPDRSPRSSPRALQARVQPLLQRLLRELGSVQRDARAKPIAGGLG